MLSNLDKSSGWIPLKNSLMNYNKEFFRSDLIAGLTVGVMLIPQGMAYALIADLPPEYGLYAALVPLIIYAFLGTSRHLSVGPVALVALLVAAAVSPIANSPEEHIALSILLALMVGLIQLLFGILRMGFLVNLLSHPVLSGFVSAAAIVIGFSQLHHLFGIDSVAGNLHEVIHGVVLQLSDIHLWTLAIGVISILIILILKKHYPKIPGPILAVSAGIGLIFFTGLEQSGVSIVGEINKGLPSPVLPEMKFELWSALFPMALAIALVAYMEAIAVAKAIEKKAKSYQIDPNKELIALGAGNIAGSFFQSFPATGSFSRSAVNYGTGAKTGIASIISAFTVAITLMILTPIFYYLPNAVLAAIIMVSIFGLIEMEQFKKLWKLGHYDRYMLLATFAGTLFIGIKEGILLGVSLSVIMLLYRSARPKYSVMGRIPGTTIYRNVRRYKTEQNPHLLIFRFDAPLHFANADYFKTRVEELILKHPKTSAVILDLNGVNEIDSTGLDILLEVIHELEKTGVEVKLAEVKSTVRDMIKRKMSRKNAPEFFMRIEDAVNSMENDLDQEENEGKNIYVDTH